LGGEPPSFQTSAVSVKKKHRTFGAFRIEDQVIYFSAGAEFNIGFAENSWKTELKIFGKDFRKKHHSFLIEVEPAAPCQNEKKDSTHDK